MKEYLIDKLYYLWLLSDDQSIRFNTKKSFDNLREQLLEDIKNLPPDEQIPLRHLTEMDLLEIEEEMYKKMSEQFNALTEKHLTIPKNVVLPGYEGLLDSKLREKSVEGELMERLQELELVHKQQQVMKQKLQDELNSMKQIKTDADIDVALCELLEKNQEDLSGNEFAAVNEILEKVKGNANKLSKNNN